MNDNYDDNYDNDNDNDNIEHFESILSKLKTTKNNNKNNNKNSKNNNKNNSTKKNKKGISFNELINNSEKLTQEKANVESITDALEKYKKIFKSPKFKNNSKTTAESFEKFALYKKHFLDLFK